MNLDIALSFTSNDPGAAFRTDLIVANVPEPGTLALAVCGMIGLALRSRRRGR